ncbi:hypothetical protein SHIRM173S_13012 [Streptomyces hirsutus]
MDSRKEWRVVYGIRPAPETSAHRREIHVVAVRPRADNDVYDTVGKRLGMNRRPLSARTHAARSRSPQLTTRGPIPKPDRCPPRCLAFPARLRRPRTARLADLKRYPTQPPQPQPRSPKGSMYPPEPDLRLDGFEAADEQTQEAFWRAIQIEQTELTPLAEHHAPDGASYHVFHNGAVTWGTPGESQLVALHLQRDSATKTFRFAHATLPLPAMAQSWLIHRGCPPKEISLAPGTGTTPADEMTRALEQRLMSDGDHFALLHSYTDDDPENSATVVVLRSLDERSPSRFGCSTRTWTPTPGPTPCARAALPPMQKPCSGVTTPSAARFLLCRRPSPRSGPSRDRAIPFRPPRNALRAAAAELRPVKRPEI